MLAVGRAGAACAAEETSYAIGPTPPGLDPYRQSAPLALPWSAVPPNFSAPAFVAAPDFSSREFRPRGRSLSEEPVAAENIMPMHGVTLAQRLSEYRWRDRIRVLTLWESGANSLTLQAGRRGSPSLQWTSRLMQRADGTHGVLDRLFAVSIAGAGRAMRAGANAPRAARTAKARDGISK